MPEMSLKDTIVTSLTAQEPWPDNVKLFQPYEVEQILLPDNASCLAVQAFLKMCNLSFEVEMRWNAEFMSPSGRVPFIKCGAFVVSELEPIVQFAANKGVTLCEDLSSEEKAEMRAYMSLISNVLVNAELYISWLDNETYNTVTKIRNSSVYPWPLSWIQTRSKRNAVAKRLKALHWHDKTLDQVLADVEQCCNSLTQRLGDRDYFFGTPTALDALLSGHIRALLSATGPKAKLMIKPITGVLLKHTLRVAHLTNMALTPQEDYLVSQVYRRQSPVRCESQRNDRNTKSRMTFKFISVDHSYGHKPFASKSIHMNRDEDIPNECPRKYMKSKQIHNFINNIIEEIFDKVEEITYEIERYGGTFELINEMYDIDEATHFLDTLDTGDVSYGTMNTSIETMNYSYDNNDTVDDEPFLTTENSGTRSPKKRCKYSAIPVKRGSNLSSRSGSLRKMHFGKNSRFPKRCSSPRSPSRYPNSTPPSPPVLSRRMSSISKLPRSPNSLSPPVRSSSSSPIQRYRTVSTSDKSFSPEPLSPGFSSPELDKKLSSSTGGIQIFSESKSTMRLLNNSEELDVESIISLIRENNTFIPKQEFIADLD